MSAEEDLREQLLKRLDQLHGLAIRYARGDRSARTERDQLEGAVQIKLALWRRAGL